MKPPGVLSGVTAGRVRVAVGFREAAFREAGLRAAGLRVPGFLLGDSLALAALVALDFLLAAAFFAPVERLADLAFLVAAAFFEAVERLADALFEVVFLLAEVALVVLAFRVRAAFLAAVTRLVALAFLVRAAFFAAVDRLREVAFFDDFFAGDTVPSFRLGNGLLDVIALRMPIKPVERAQRFLWCDRERSVAVGDIAPRERESGSCRGSVTS